MISNYLANCLKAYTFDKQAIKEIFEQITWQKALLVIWPIVFVISALNQGISLFTTSSPLAMSMMLGFVLMSIFFTLLLIPVGYFIGAGILHLFLMLLGGNAGYNETLKGLISFSLVPTILSFLVQVLSDIVPSSNGIIGTIFMIISSLIIVWAIIVEVIGYSYIHQLDYMKTTLAVVVIPLALLLIISLILGVGSYFLIQSI